MPKTKPKPPPHTTVLLVRHGQTPTTGAVLPGRAKGLHLADKGREQAEAVAERIAALPKIDAVYASPLERTKETAAPIGKARGLKVQLERGLLECDFGEWTGAKLKDLAKKPEWTTVQRYPSGFRFPGGESFAEMQTRICDAGAPSSPCPMPIPSRRRWRPRSAPTSTCSSASSSRRARSRPSPTAPVARWCWV
jgi:hypothetical protein